MLAWVLAYWTWAWFSPHPEVRAPALATPGGNIEAAGGLFGQAPQATPLMSGTIQLLGVIASSGKRGEDSTDPSGYALLSYAGQPARPVKEGEEISSGITLFKVHPGEVIIDRGGGLTETVALPEKKNTAPTTAALK